MLPAPFVNRFKQLSVNPGSSKTELSLREREIKSVVLIQEHSECCKTETENGGRNTSLIYGVKIGREQDPAMP